MKNGQEKDWGAEYHGWQKSGLSQQAYSNQSGYSLWTFKNGIAKSGCRKRLKKSVTHTPTRFVELQATESGSLEKEISPEAYCEIRFKGKPGLRIESAETLVQLRSLVKGLWG
jgi:hypothetical protein